MEIRIENLSKKFGSQKAVDNISFTVRKGEILGFLGPNGAGKTTTMKMITTYLSIGEGNIFIGENSLRDSAEELRRHIGYLPENNPLYEDMHVMDYLEFCAALQGYPKSKLKDRVVEMIRKCGLDPEKHKRIGELSKGYRQRVGLAQAMIHDPDILILDEPTTGLDPNQIVEIRKLIRELGKEKTVILSTHILPEVEATCDRILIINKGKIVADGTAETLRKKAKGQEILKIRAEDASAEEILAALKGLQSVAEVTISNPNELRFEITSKPEMTSAKEVFRLFSSRNWTLTEMIPQESRLEDIFRDLTLTLDFSEKAELISSES